MSVSKKNVAFMLLLLPSISSALDDCTSEEVDDSWLFWKFNEQRLNQCKSLALNTKSLGNRGTTALAQALRGNTELTVLKLENCSIGPQGAAALASVLSETKIEKLDLDANAIGAEGAAALANALASSRLEELDLEQNGIGDRGAAALAAALRGSSLTILDVEVNGIGDEGGTALARALRRNRALTELGESAGPRTLVYRVPSLTVDQRSSPARAKTFTATWSGRGRCVSSSSPSAPTSGSPSSACRTPGPC